MPTLRRTQKGEITSAMMASSLNSAQMEEAKNEDLNQLLIFNQALPIPNDIKIDIDSCDSNEELKHVSSERKHRS